MKPLEAPVLITGASQRIGLHCAKRLIADGHQVIASYRTDRPGVSELRDMGAYVLFADFSSAQGILDFIDRVQGITSSLRAIVHNASTWLPEQSGKEADAFSQLVNVHMLAPYLINLHCAALLKQSPTSDIVHISDDVVRKGSTQHMAYSASKAGMDNLTLSFAARLAPHTKVNGIAPALIQFHEHDNDEYRVKTLGKSALGIEPGPDVVYQSLRYLFDSPYVTGTTLSLNGGRHLK